MCCALGTCQYIGCGIVTNIIIVQRVLIWFFVVVGCVRIGCEFVVSH